MLIANDSFAHWRYKTAHRTAAIGRGKCLQPAACSITSRSAGTSLVVACTRAFSISRSHRATAPFAACLSSFAGPRALKSISRRCASNGFAEKLIEELAAIDVLHEGCACRPKR
jgi:hypothetical protein